MTTRLHVVMAVLLGVALVAAPIAADAHARKRKRPLPPPPPPLVCMVYGDVPPFMVVGT